MFLIKLKRMLCLREVKYICVYVKIHYFVHVFFNKNIYFQELDNFGLIYFLTKIYRFKSLNMNSFDQFGKNKNVIKLYKN